MKKALNRAVLQTANLSKVVKRKRGGRRKTERSRGRRKGMETERGGGWRVEMDEEISEKETSETCEEMEGEEGRNWKMNERKSDKNSCF